MTTKGRTMADGCAGLDVVVNDELMWLMWDISSRRVKGRRILQMTGTKTMLEW